MKFESYWEIELYLEDINEVINQLLWFLYDPKTVNDKSELYDAILSIPEIIEIIETILQKELK